MNPATGEFFVDRTDFELSGVGLPFRMRRVYRNRWTYDGPIGFNWTHAYDQRLVFSQTACNRTAHWLTGEGSMLRFDETATGSWISSPPAPYRLAVASDGTFVITAPDGIRSTFRANGTLKEIRDLNDNVLAFTWGAVPGVAAGGPLRLLTAKDTVNRTIRFVYGGDGYLDRVEVPSAGITVHYKVDGNKDLSRVGGAGGIAESYEYQNGFAAISRSYLPTSELQGACVAACGADAATCHGPSPCDQVAENLQEACVAECFDPAECQKGCSVCETKCESHPEGQACRDGCTSGCESNCSLSAALNCLFTAWTEVALACADQCLDVCRDFCDPTLVCERHGGSTLTPCSTGPTCVEEVCVGMSSSSGGSSTTVRGNTYATCDKIIDSWDQDGPHSGGVCISPLPSWGWCCKNNCYDCCLKGDNCPGGCNKDVKCLDRCVDTFLNGSPGTSSCRPTSSPGCLVTARNECPGACKTACAQNCGAACTDNCKTACAANCNDRSFCQRECGKQPRAATCKRACVAECVANNTHPYGKVVYGVPEEANHNLLRVKDATGAVYVENVYQEDIFSPGFDRVERHSFGGDRITFQHYDLVTPGAPPIAAADEPFLSATREFTWLCPTQCPIDVGSPNRWTEGWVAVSPGEYLVLTGPGGGDPAPEGWPVTAGPKFEDPRTLGAYAWYELRRTAATTAMLWPPVKLPAEGLAIHTPEGTLTLRASGDRPGQVTFSRLRADEPTAVLGTAGYPTALLTLVRTPAGFRAYRGRAVGAAAVFPAGACTPELTVRATAGGPTLAAGSCKGTATFRELARRSGRAGEPVWSGQLTDPRGPIFWSFNEGTGVRSGSSPSGDPWRSNAKNPWSGLCEPASRIPTDPACLAAGEAMKGLGGPPVPEPDCGAPWASRGTASTTGYQPEPDAQDVAMGCVGGGVEVPPLPPDTCPVAVYVAPITGPTAEKDQPIARASVVRDAAGSVWTYHSSVNGQLLRGVNNTSGARTDRNFDLLGRLTGERSPFGDRSCVTYDDAWNPVRVVSLPAPGRYAPTPQIEQRTSFAAHGRPEVLFDPNQPAVPLVTYHYDAKMNVTAIEPAAPAPRVDYRRDARGRVDQITHPDGTRTAIAYKPSNGVVETITFDEGGALATTRTFGSNALGQITSEAEPGHASHGFTWHKDGRIDSESIILAAGATPLTTTYLYDPTGKVFTERGPVVTRSYSYHGRGLFQTVTEQPTVGDGPSRVTCLGYDGRGRVVEMVDPEGRRTRFTRDGNGEVTRVERGIWSASSAAWDNLCAQNLTDGASPGTETLIASPRDAAGFINSVELASTAPGQPAIAQSFVYDGYGRVVEATIANGVRHRRGYDSRNRVSWVGTYKPGNLSIGADLVGGIPNPDGPLLAALATYAYDPVSRLTQERRRWFVDRPGAPRQLLTPSGWITRTVSHFDAQNAVEETDLEGRVTRVERDALGRVRRISLPDGVTSESFVYSDEGRTTVRTVAPSATSSGTLVHTLERTDLGALRAVRLGDATVAGASVPTLASTSFDAFGRPDVASSRAGAVAYAYSPSGELAGIFRVLPDGGREPYQTIGRNRVGAVSSFTDGVGNTTTFAFDHLGRLRHEVYPDGTAIAFTFRGGTGLHLTRVDRNGDTTHYAYDAFGDLASAAAAKANPPAGWGGTTSVSFTRDAFGLASASASNRPADPGDDVAYTFVRDSTGAVVEESSTLFPGEPLVYLRDPLGRARTITQGSNILTYTYEGLGRIAQAKLGATVLADYVHDGSGLPKQVTYGARGAGNVQLTEVNTHDAEGRLLTSRTGVGAAPLFGHDLFWGSEDTLARKDAWIGVRPASPLADLFLSDAFSRLQAASLQVPGLSTWSSGSITRAQVQGALGSGPRREDYALDAADNWTAVTRGGSTTTTAIASDNRYTQLGGTITSDVQGNTVGLPDGTTYGYDGLGHLVTAAPPGGLAWSFRHDPFGRLVGFTSGAAQTHFQYADGVLLREAGASGSSLHVPGAGGLPLAIIRGGAIHYLHSQWGERVAYATTSGAQIAERYEYDAYGGPVIRDTAGSALGASAVGARLLLSGQPYIPELGLYRLGARFYRPALGRFLSPDPLGLAAGPNRFAYAGAQPMMLVDPSGLGPEDPAAGVSDVTGQLSSSDALAAMASPTWKSPIPDPIGEAHAYAASAARTARDRERIEENTPKLYAVGYSRNVTFKGRPVFIGLGDPAYAEQQRKEFLSKPGNRLFADLALLALTEIGGRLLFLRSLSASEISVSQIHEAAGGIPKFRNYNPTAVLHTAEGPTFVARGPTQGLTRAQLELIHQAGYEPVLMSPDRLVPPAFRIHPDIRVIVHARLRGLTPLRLEVAGQPFCPYCSETIGAFEGEIVAPGTVVFPGP